MVSIMPIPSGLTGYDNQSGPGQPRYMRPITRTNADTPLADMKRLLGDDLASGASPLNSLFKQIPARVALDGAVVELMFDHPNNFAFMCAINDMRVCADVNFVTGARNATPWKIRVMDSNKVKLFHNIDNSPLYVSGTYAFANGGLAGINSDLFYMGSSSNGFDFIDLDKTSFYDFLRQFWTLTSVLTNVPFCGTGGLWRPMGSCKAPVTRPIMVFLSLGPGFDRMQEFLLDKTLQADCCMGKNKTEEQIYCDILALKRDNQKCDLFFDGFCADFPNHQYCGCFPINVEKEYQALPKELKTPTYEPILKSTPRCWVKGCATGYIPYNYRDMSNCKITICDIDQNVIGDNYIKNISGQIMCEGGVAMETPKPPPSNSTGSGSTGSGSTGSGSTGSGSTGSGSTGSGSAGSGSTDQQEESFDFDNLPWGIILAILFVILILLVVIVTVAKKKKNSSEIKVTTVMVK